MFDGFREGMEDAGGLSLFDRQGGTGPAVLLLHGHPRTSATWHRVAPRLVEQGLTVICADLPGYGRSGKPEPTHDHESHSKRSGARHLLNAMTELGHDRFAVVGHDRGSYYALRMALDHPERVTRVALLDCLPIGEHLDRTDARFATAWWHWFFFAQPDFPGRVINADPDAWYHGDPDSMGEENFAEWRTAIHDPAVVRGMLEDYRAGLASTPITSEQTGKQGVGFSSHSSCCGPHGTTWKTSMATHSSSGRTGLTWSPDTASTPVMPTHLFNAVPLCGRPSDARSVRDRSLRILDGYLLDIAC